MDFQNDLRMQYGLFEFQLTRYVRAFARDSKVAYDVGSAEGYYCIAFSRLMGKESHMVAFESSKLSLHQLEATLKRNELTDRVTLVEGFVGDGASDASIAIDDLIRDRNYRAPDIVKIDVEGDELKVLRGMQSTLMRVRPKLIIEVHSKNLMYACIEFLLASGYDVKSVDVGWLGRVLPEQRGKRFNAWIVASDHAQDPLSQYERGHARSSPRSSFSKMAR